MFRTKPLIVLLLVIFVVVAGILSFVSRYAKQTAAPSLPPVVSEIRNPPTPPAHIEKPTSVKPRISAPPPIKPTQIIKIMSPASSEKWVVGETNQIKWSEEGGVAGSIYLIKASDASVVGWINSETGPHQTSVDWDARNVSINRYGSQRRTAERGDYIVKIKFDAQNIPEISSGIFSIIYKAEAPVETYTVTIKGFSFSQNSLAVRQKDKITFANNDAVTHRVILSSFSPFVIEPGQSYTFDTSPLFPGPYDFYSEAYSSLKLKVTVR